MSKNGLAMLKLKRMAIDTYGENVAFLSRHCRLYRPEDFIALNKIEISANGTTILATLNIVDDQAILRDDELGLSVAAFERLGAEAGHDVRLTPTTPPKSLDHIRSKIEGRALSDEAFQSIIRDIAAHRYSKMELAAFVAACAGYMTEREVLGLTRAMVEVGARLDWSADQIVDKHCIGGIPGNRTSMIVVPIVAAHGLRIPKTSSRAITSPAGTADTMEVLACVDLGMDHLQEIVRRNNGCLAWGGNVNLSPADDILIAVERPLSIDTAQQMTASIMSKKLAAGVTDLLIDIPVGPTAKVRTHAEAVHLRKLFEYVAKEIGIRLEVVITDGSQPIGYGVGPVLEARDVMAVLKGEATAPRDLRERSLMLAGNILDFDPELRGGEGYKRATELLDSGKALEKMNAIIEDQGAASVKFELGDLVHEVVAGKDGVVTEIDCFRIARIARTAGAPFDKGAGIDLAKKVGDPVQAGEALYKIHARIESDFGFAQAMAIEGAGVSIDGESARG